jgi:exosortase A-associated hydrolase 2
MTFVAVSTPAHPFFLSCGTRKLFALRFDVPAGMVPRGATLLVPPFAEESNKSRRMLVQQARALSACGYGALIVDLYGTGESAGDFFDARWDLWREDVACSCDWLERQYAVPVSLIGLRLGALLALTFASKQPSALERIVLWQPVLSGEAMMTQFLRTRLVSGLMAQVETKETTQTLRAQSRSGQPLEVSGYLLAPELLSAIDSAVLAPLAAPYMPPLYWFEIVGDAAQGVTPASRRVIETWRERGVKVDVKSVSGPTFWSVVEIAEAPALVTATTEVFARTS